MEKSKATELKDSILNKSFIGMDQLIQRTKKGKIEIAQAKLGLQMSPLYKRLSKLAYYYKLNSQNLKLNEIQENVVILDDIKKDILSRALDSEDLRIIKKELLLVKKIIICLERVKIRR